MPSCSSSAVLRGGPGEREQMRRPAALVRQGHRPTRKATTKASPGKAHVVPKRTDAAMRRASSGLAGRRHPAGSAKTRVRDLRAGIRNRWRPPVSSGTFRPRIGFVAPEQRGFRRTGPVRRSGGMTRPDRPPAAWRLADDPDLTGPRGFDHAVTCSPPGLDVCRGRAHVIDLRTRKSIGWASTRNWLVSALNAEVAQGPR